MKNSQNQKNTWQQQSIFFPRCTWRRRNTRQNTWWSTKGTTHRSTMSSSIHMCRWVQMMTHDEIRMSGKVIFSFNKYIRIWLPAELPLSPVCVFKCLRWHHSCQEIFMTCAAEFSVMLWHKSVAISTISISISKISKVHFCSLKQYPQYLKYKFVIL